MTADTRQKVQLVLAAAIAVAALRTGYILYQRHEANTPQPKAPPPPLNADYYVTPKKLYPYDLKSARQLTEQPVWVKVGYAYAYFPYNAARQRTEFSHQAGFLLPIEKLQIRNVVLDSAPSAPGEKQVMATFDENGKSYAFSIGSEKDGVYKIQSDDMLFIQDPRQLYSHWPTEVWDAINHHKVKPGMNELQADFAIGLGIPDDSRDPQNRSVNYPNGGHPITVTYRNGRAVNVS